MNQIDPMATKYASLTPYNFAFNDPVRYNDPLGDEANDEALSEAKRQERVKQMAENRQWAESWRENVRAMYGIVGDDDLSGGMFAKSGAGVNWAMHDAFFGEKNAEKFVNSWWFSKTKETMDFSPGKFWFRSNADVSMTELDGSVAGNTSSKTHTDIWMGGTFRSNGSSLQPFGYNGQKLSNRNESMSSYDPRVSNTIGASNAFVSVVEMGYAASLVSNAGKYSKASFSELKHLINGTKYLGAGANVLSIANVGYNVATTGHLKGSDIGSLLLTGGTIIAGAVCTTAAAPIIVGVGIVGGIGLLIWGKDLDNLVDIDLDF
jgi:hypothetical protein